MAWALLERLPVGREDRDLAASRSTSILAPVVCWIARITLPARPDDVADAIGLDEDHLDSRGA